MKKVQEQKIETAIAAIKAVWADILTGDITFEQFNDRLNNCYAPTGGLDIRVHGLGPQVPLPTMEQHAQRRRKAGSYHLRAAAGK